MIWSNKGHEFDKIGSKFLPLKRIYIYGAGSFGSDAAKLLSGIGANIFFVDQDKSQQKKYMNIDVACRAGVIINAIDDFLNLSEDYENKKIILQYIMGYTQTGYCSFCSMCEGYCSINTKQIPVAEQYSI